MNTDSNNNEVVNNVNHISQSKANTELMEQLPPLGKLVKIEFTTQEEDTKNEHNIHSEENALGFMEIENKTKDMQSFEGQDENNLTNENSIDDDIKKSSQKTKLSLQDFQLQATLGKGAYGEVLLVKRKSNSKQYALKVMDKTFLRKEQKQYQVYVEKEVLSKLDHPNIIKLYSSFQDNSKLYFVIEYCNGGEFSHYLRIQRLLTKEQLRFYAAEIINILEYLHTNGIAHRDFKPENLMLSEDGHLKCIDFGTAKDLNSKVKPSQLYGGKVNQNDIIEIEFDFKKQQKEHRSTFVGTAQYVSPELLEDSQCDAPADLWAFGCIVYLMATGQYAFHGPNEYMIFQKIKNLNINYPENMDPVVKDLVQALLKRNPLERLGAGAPGSGNDYAALKSHPLFEGLDFENLINSPAPKINVISPFKSNKELKFETFFPNNTDQNNSKESQPELEPELSTFSQSATQIKVIMSGLILKKYWIWFYKPSYLVLTAAPKLVCYEPSTSAYEEEIRVTAETQIQKNGKDGFVIYMGKEKYYFKSLEHPIEKWIDAIYCCIQKLRK